MDKGDVVSINEPIKLIEINTPLTSDWEDFGDNGGRIRFIEFDDNLNFEYDSTIALYTAQAESVVYWHSHNAIESCTCYGYATVYIGERVDGDLSKIKVTDVVELSPSDVLTIGEGVIHMFIFRTYTRLILSWHPRFEGNNFTAKFLHPSEEEQDRYHALDALAIGANKLFGK